MKLLRFELKKNFGKPFLWLAFLSLLVLNSFVIVKENNTVYVGQFAGRGDSKPAFEKLYEGKLRGELTKEKAEFVISEFNRLSKLVSARVYRTTYDPETYTGYEYLDWYLFSADFYRPMRYLSGYARTAKEIAARAEAYAVFYADHGVEYQVRKNNKIVSTFQGRKLSAFYNTYGVDYYLTYTFSSALILLFLALSLAPVFSIEQDTEMNKIINVSAAGQKNIAYLKILSSLLWTGFVCLIFRSVEWIVFSVTFGLEGLELPLYALEPYQYTFLSLRIREFIFLSFSLQFLFFAIFTILMLLFSRWVRKPVLTFILGIAGGVTLYWLNAETMPRLPSAFSLVNPANLIRNAFLFGDFSVVNVLNYPLFRAQIAFFSSALILIFLLFALIFSLRRKRL